MANRRRSLAGTAATHPACGPCSAIRVGTRAFSVFATTRRKNHEQADCREGPHGHGCAPFVGEPEAILHDPAAARAGIQCNVRSSLVFFLGKLTSHVFFGCARSNGAFRTSWRSRVVNKSRKAMLSGSHPAGP